MIKSKSIICFGEVLWDMLPTGKIAGGAPMNVAYHANNLGIQSEMVSKIGKDDLGNELMDFLNKKGVDTSLVQLDFTFDTGTVKVILDEKGSPAYEIIQPVAWDFIRTNEAIQTAIQKIDAFVYGSLATRNETSRKTLFELLAIAPFKVLDVNLRAPFYSQELLEPLLQQANIVKMNDEEVQLIGGWYMDSDNEILKATSLKEKFDFQTLIVTKGAAGAFCLHKNEIYSNAGFPAKVVDTIGSGDAFLAAFLSQYLKGANISHCLEFACAAGAYVATQKGGTPASSTKFINDFILQAKSSNLN